MPIKQVVCSICKETVNKAVTYHVGGTDRACRKHEGVEAKKQELEQAKVKKAAEQVEKAERQHRERHGFEGAPEDMFKPKCWVCLNTGLRQQEFFLRVLVEMQKQEKVLGGPVNPFDPKHRIAMKERCIFVITKEKGLAAIPNMPRMFRDLVDMAGGVVAICGECCGKFKIEPLAKISGDQLLDGMVLAELIKPAIEKMAVQELVRDN